MKKQIQGFTLIELMVVVVIIALLASIALPSYQEYVRRSARADARAVIMNLAQLEERNFSDRGAYAPVDGTSTGPWVATNYYSGNSYAGRKYDITVATANANSTYTISATPTNGFSDPNCGTLTLTSTGTKNSATSNPDYCWR